jgi:hypothetical protein
MARSTRRARPFSALTRHVLALVALLASVLGQGADAAQASTLASPASGGQSYYRYMVPAELESVQQTGLLRGGRPGETFFTADSYTSAAEAQDKLALPDPPQLRVRFIILNTITLSREGSIVEPAFGGQGGGREWATFDQVQVEIIDVQPLT